VTAFIDNARLPVADEIRRRLETAQSAFFAVAFIRESGVDTLEASLRALIARGGRLCVLFGNAFGITEPGAIRRLQALGAELRYHRGADTFHPKGYLFGSSTATTSAIVGSSNISASGLKAGVEWNVILESPGCDLRPVVEAAQRVWNSPDATSVTDAVIDELERSARSPQTPPHLQDQQVSHLPFPPSTGSGQRPGVEFLFQVNKSFAQPKSSFRRPVTVPIDFNAVMREQGLDADPVEVHGPGGERFSGRIYTSTNNQGEYHQIVVNGFAGDALARLPLGRQVRVQIVKNSGGIEVHIRASA